MNIRFFLLLLVLSFTVILGMLSWSAYGYYETIHSDDPIDPHLFIESWSGKIIRWDLAIELSHGESYTLNNADIIETAPNSFGIVNWPDRSITRLWPQTRIIIEKMNVSRDYATIEISYEMKRGKVWNNVIHLLVWESYFETRLPKDNIIAGVRGTVFEVNLDRGYIQAIEHSTHLSDTSWKSLDLFPGELVSSENIWVRKGREWIDTTWNDWNTLSDATYEQIRALSIKTRINTLWQQSNSYLSLGGLTEKILSYFPGFESIAITRYLESGNTGSLQNLSESVLIEYYQKMSGVTSSEYRDILRTTLIQNIRDTDASKRLKNLLERASVWESIDTGKILPWAEKFFQERGINPTEFTQRFNDGMKNDTKRLFGAFSGSLQWILGF